MKIYISEFCKQKLPFAGIANCSLSWEQLEKKVNDWINIEKIKLKDKRFISGVKSFEIDGEKNPYFSVNLPGYENQFEKYVTFLIFNKKAMIKYCDIDYNPRDEEDYWELYVFHCDVKTMMDMEIIEYDIAKKYINAANGNWFKALELYDLKKY